MIKKFIEIFKSKDAVKMVFFGDSVTQGFFESHEQMHGTVDYEAVYHNVLKKYINFLFPKKRINIINSGVGGETASAAVKRLDSDVLAYSPDIAVVCFGLNDINDEKERFVNSLSEIFKRLNEAEIPTVYMTPNMLNTRVIMPALKDYAQKTAEYQTTGRMDAYMTAAKAAAEENGITVCDCYSAWKHLGELGADTSRLLANGINHPKREMHRLFAHMLMKTVFFD